jgi:hypothetical protein
MIIYVRVKMKKKKHKKKINKIGGLFVTADSCRDEVKTKTSSKKDSKGGDDIISSILSSLDVDISMDMMLG